MNKLLLLEKMMVFIALFGVFVVYTEISERHERTEQLTQKWEAERTDRIIQFRKEYNLGE